MSSLEQHPQWKAVLKVQQKLTGEGYQALVAGGAVRDLLLSRVPSDIDLATDARPEHIEKMFEKTVMVGKAFGVSRVIVDGQDIEVATFRRDGEYLDGRKPTSVEFCDAKEDALRRDFTINGMFYDPDRSQVIDYVDGQKDIMKKTIRCIGDPDKRFEEDKLRILRALRFHAQLNFPIEEKTMLAVAKHSVQIHQVSMERIRDEWQKMLLADHATEGIGKVHSSGLWAQIFKDWTYQPDLYERHWGESFQEAEMAWLVWFLIHAWESDEALVKEAMRWKLPKKQIQRILFCSQSLPKLKNLTSIEPVDIAIFLNKPNGRLAVQVYQRLFLGKIKEDWFEKLRAGEAYFDKGQLPEPMVTGDDLIQYGIAPGPKIAQGLKELYRLQLDEGIQSKEELLQKWGAN